MVEIPKYSGADSTFTANSISTAIQNELRFHRPVFGVAVEETSRSWSDQLSSTELGGNTTAMTATARALSPEALGARRRERLHATSSILRRISRNPSRFTYRASEMSNTITLSIWYAFSSGAQALSIGKGYGALRGRIREKASQNLISALWLQKWLETIVPII